MGMADLVPGVSGGTIAFVSGIYEALVNQISKVGSSLRRAFFKGEFQALSFLTIVFLGLITGIALFAMPIKHALRDPALKSILYALFFGAVMGSAISILIENRYSLRPKMLLIGLLLGIFFLICQSYLGQQLSYDISIKSELIKDFDQSPANWDPKTHQLRGVSINELSYLYYHGYLESNIVYARSVKKLITIDDVWLDQNGSNGWAIFFHGLVASIAMILPGISGGYILVLLGSYSHVIHAISSFISGVLQFQFDQINITYLIKLGLGIITGLLFFSKIIDRFFKRYHQSTLFLIVGFMMGTVVFLWPFWSTEWRVIPTEIIKRPIQQVFLSPVVPSLLNHQTLIALSVFFLSLIVTIALGQLMREKEDV